MIIVVGSENGVKIEAVKAAFETAFKQSVTVVAVNVESGVSPQPFNEELFVGAKNRALNAMRVATGDFYVGIEGGAVELFGQRFITTAICVADKNGTVSFGMTGGFPVPDAVWKRISSGEELGDVMDSMFNMKGTKKGIGAIGILTKGAINRKSYLEHGVMMALVRYILPDAWAK